MLGLRLQVQKGKGAWLLLTHGKNMSCLPSPIPTSPWHALPICPCPRHFCLPTCNSSVPPGLRKAPSGSHPHWVSGSCLLTCAAQGGTEGRGQVSAPSVSGSSEGQEEGTPALALRAASAALSMLLAQCRCCVPPPRVQVPIGILKSGPTGPRIVSDPWYGKRPGSQPQCGQSSPASLPQ